MSSHSQRSNTNAMKPMLAKSYKGQSVKGWLMSEKLDGVRAIWDGSKLVSRNGKQFFAPEWFLSQLPAGVALDGELFIGRGKFQPTVGAVKKESPVDREWRKIRYCVFDAPQALGGFEDRLAFCESTLAGSTIASVVPHRECAGKEDMESFFEALCADGAEGIMLRAPGSSYENRRSANLLKYKPFESDEAVVMGHKIGEGRLAGRVGALIVKWGKVTFRVGSGLSDEVRMNPPKVGALITFGFCGLTDGGCPRFPTFLAERSYEQIKRPAILARFGRILGVCL
jgi:DNA ligase-1